MLAKTMLSRDMNAILSSKGSDGFAKGEKTFYGNLKKDSQVVFDDNSVGYRTTLLTTLNSLDCANIKLRDTITEIATGENYKITQILKENKVLARLVLEKN